MSNGGSGRNARGVGGGGGGGAGRGADLEREFDAEITLSQSRVQTRVNAADISIDVVGDSRFRPSPFSERGFTPGAGLGTALTSTPSLS
jgi:hypothetical protein